MTVVFWFSAVMIVYVYVGYPIILRVWTRLRAKPLRDDASSRKQTVSADANRDATPSVSIVIAARNEGARLTARIDNLRSIDYPPARRQIIVVSDGSTDDTERILEKRYGRFVDVVTVPQGGKALALNAGVARARSDIVVFADARQVFAQDALRELVAPFADPEVGAVTGELLLDCESALFSNRRASSDRRRGHVSQLRAAAIERRINPERRLSVVSTIADGVGMYWRYEKELRRLESAVGSTLGVTGAIYAMRRALWQPLPADTILDDVLAPMRVVMAGYRVVFNDRARAFDRAPVDAEAESRRKIRTLAGNYQILWLEPRLIFPWRNPVWAQYVSHKLGRLAVPYALMAMFSSSLALAQTHVFYLGLLMAQVGFYLLAGYGAVLEVTSRAAATPRARSGEGTEPPRHEVPQPAREIA
jgi:biofilm PGA synthesis N-glycosyltransferase PgaC